MKQRIRLGETSLHRIIKESVKRVLNEEKEWTFCNSGDDKYDYLSNQLFDYVENKGISVQMEQNKTFQEGRNLLHKALKKLEVGLREYY